MLLEAVAGKGVEEWIERHADVQHEVRDPVDDHVLRGHLRDDVAVMRPEMDDEDRDPGDSEDDDDDEDSSSASFTEGAHLEAASGAAGADGRVEATPDLEVGHGDDGEWDDIDDDHLGPVVPRAPGGRPILSALALLVQTREYGGR